MKELGTHYQKQLQNQKLAENKMELRANQMADLIQAPGLKDSAQKAMLAHAGELRAKYDAKIKKESEQRT